MTTTTILYVTVPDLKTADILATTLVEARLAACANILPQMRSVYRWEEVIRASEEVVLIVKTTKECAEAARNLILENHPYDTPCVIALPVSANGSYPTFLNWIGEQITT